MPALQERMVGLQEARKSARAGVAVSPQYMVSGKTLGKLWAEAEGVEARRQLLLGQLEAVRVGVGGGRGRVLDVTRIELVWRQLDPGEKARAQHVEDVFFMRAWRSETT